MFSEIWSFQYNPKTKKTDHPVEKKDFLINQKSMYILLAVQDKKGIAYYNFLFQGQYHRWLVVWVLQHINLCRLFNAKLIFIQIISSILNNSV